MNKISILHAPSPLGLKPPAPGQIPGTRKMPSALRVAGLHGALKADYAGEVLPPRYDPGIDLEFGVRNVRGVRNYSVVLATALETVLDRGKFPLVLGGDCSILIGCALGLRRRGRFGLVFLDGHADHLTPETTATGGIAGMDLAVTTGTGLELLTNIEGRRPYIRTGDAVQLGCRDADVVSDAHHRIAGTEIRLVGLDQIRSQGAHAAVQTALGHLSAAELHGIWIHLDADVLSDVVMPAVDSRQPGGLEVDELVEILRMLIGSGRVVGLNLTIYDPVRDPTGEAGRVLTAALVAGLSGVTY